MKIDFSTVLTNFDGTPYVSVPETKDAPAKYLTLKEVALMVLGAPLPDDQTLSPMDKFNLGRIGHAIATDLELPVEDLAKLKDRIGKGVISPAIVFSAWNIFEA
jgi:hypothetical protein